MPRRKTKTRTQKNAPTSTVMPATKQENSQSDSVSIETSTMEKSGTGDATSNPPADQPHADRIAATLDSVEKLLSQSNETSAPASPDWSSLLENSLRKTEIQLASQLDQFKQGFEKQLNDLHQIISKSLDSKSATLIAAATADQSNADAKAETSDSLETEWERRKREMYPEHEQETPATQGKTVETAIKAKAGAGDKDELASLQESLHDSIESLDEVQAVEIEELRAQLTEKLREAEIELSINRAKLDQRKAKIELQQSELERREKSLAEKYSTIDKDGVPQKAGILDRLTRHLGAQKEVDTL